MNRTSENSETVLNPKPFFSIALILFIVGAVPLSAQASLSGEVTAFSGIFFQSSGSSSAGDYFQPSTSLKLAPSYSSGLLTIKAELTGSISLSDSGYDVAMKLGEAYATLDVADGLSVTAGSKIISWGTALTSNPEGFINPVDSLSQLVSENRSDWLLPVMLVSGKYIAGPFSFEVVALPFFRPSTIPAKSSRWYPSSLAALDVQDGFSIPATPPSTPGVDFSVDTTPDDLELNWENMQGAGRMSLSMGAVDFGLSGWYGFTKTPAYDVMVTPGATVDVVIDAQYKRQGAIGADMSATIFDSSVVWMETALYLPEYYVGEETSGLPVSLEKNTLKSAFGLDRTFGIGGIGDLYCAMESNLSWILDYDTRLTSSVGETELGATLITEYRTPSQDVTVRLVVMEPDFLTVDTTGQYLARLSLKAKLTDGYSLTLGTVLFGGSGGTVGQYADNDFAYASITASF
jgi:hypothetical protein